jgi:hypothetical protein
MRLASGCIQLGDELGTELESEILRLAGEHSTQQWPEARRKLELECLRMAADCMQLVGAVQSFKLQQRFLRWRGIDCRRGGSSASIGHAPI